MSHLPKNELDDFQCYKLKTILSYHTLNSDPNSAFENFFKD